MHATTEADCNTTRGTPCARSWTADWIARVEQRENELDRRICGARTIGHAPCPAPSEHPSGRCAHHGGFSLTGAPEGNRNAAVHFLYARRIMPCGPHCPAWKSCPMGGGAADGGKELLSRAFPDRPACPFEQAEYNAVVTDALRRTQNHHENAWGLHLAHQVALQTILVSRAARALATSPFVDQIEVYQGEHYTVETKAAAALIAYEKLSRELRRWVLLLERCYAWISCDKDTALHHRRRQATDTFADPDALAATAVYPEAQELFNRRDRREGQPQHGQDGPDLPENENKKTENKDTETAATESAELPPTDSSVPSLASVPENSLTSTAPSTVNAPGLSDPFSTPCSASSAHFPSAPSAVNKALDLPNPPDPPDPSPKPWTYPPPFAVKPP